MELSFFISIGLFAFVMSATPGPNNLMLLASGVQYGFWRTMPHMFGIIIGVMCLNLSVLMGLGALFELYPSLYDALKIVGSLYLLWLAWKIANAPTHSDDDHSQYCQSQGNQFQGNQSQSRQSQGLQSQGNETITNKETNNKETSKEPKSRPMSVLSAALFQFVNPKTWTMSIGSMSTFTLAGALYIESGLWIVAAFALLGFIGISLWAGLGVVIRQWLTTQKRKRNFNWLMGGLTAATLVLIVV